jgi:hypothetical protein
MRTEEDEAFEELEQSLGWHKQKIVHRQLSTEENMARNVVLEEIATAFDKMKSSGDTAASFAAYVRGMKT